MHHSAEEAAVINLLADLLGEEPSKHHTFPWLRSKVGRHLIIDAYFPSANIAVEYDGFQHRHFVPWYHRTLGAFAASQERDATKDRLLTEYGIHLLRIRDDEPRTTDHLLRRLSLAVAEGTSASAPARRIAYAPETS